MSDPYRRLARVYDRFVEPQTAALRRIAMSLGPPQTGMSVLDVGCGTGINLGLYLEAGCEVTGIDLSPSMLEVARSKLGDSADLRLGDATTMPFPEDVFDLVSGMLTLHEMPGAIRTGVLDEMARVVRADGRLLLTDFHPGPLRLPKGWYHRLITLVVERAAGREHFRNYRHFIAHGGLPQLLAGHELAVVRQKILAGGNMIVCVLQPAGHRRGSSS